MALYTAEEAAEELRTTPRRIRQMCESGQLKALKTGRSWLVELGRPPRNDYAERGRDKVRRSGRSA